MKIGELVAILKDENPEKEVYIDIDGEPYSIYESGQWMGKLVLSGQTILDIGEYVK